MVPITEEDLEGPASNKMNSQEENRNKSGEDCGSQNDDEINIHDSPLLNNLEDVMNDVDDQF